MNAKLVYCTKNRMVGRGTPCEPGIATRPRNGAHEVTRPTNPTTTWVCGFKQALNTALLSVMLVSLIGCAHYTVNAPNTADRAEGYYYRNHKRENKPDDILLLLAFSGGRTRAAAFSYGVLEALRDTTFEVEGKKRRLLDEVDAISSVSGGSVTAAAYGLYGDRVFDVFEPAFLKRNVERALLGHVLNPLHWPALWSPD